MFPLTSLDQVRDLNRHPVGHRGWNNHPAPHGGNHLIQRPLGPLIPEAKLSHAAIAPAPSLLLGLQQLCVSDVFKGASKLLPLL